MTTIRGYSEEGDDEARELNWNGWFLSYQNHLPNQITITLGLPPVRVARASPSYYDTAILYQPSLLNKRKTPCIIGWPIAKGPRGKETWRHLNLQSAFAIETNAYAENLRPPTHMSLKFCSPYYCTFLSQQRHRNRQEMGTLSIIEYNHRSHKYSMIPRNIKIDIQGLSNG